MAKQDKMITCFLLFQGIVGGATFAWLALRTELSVSAWIIFIAQILAALAAGIGSLRQRRWAALLGLVVFAIQVPIIATQTATFYAWLAVHLDVAMTWQGQAKLGSNLVALGMLLWASVRYRMPNNSFKPNPLRDAA